MSYSLNSFKGVIQGIKWGTTIGLTTGILGVQTIAHMDPLGFLLDVSVFASGLAPLACCGGRMGPS